MVMEPTQSPDIQNQTKKVWHAPQCTKKAWKTPQFVAIAFENTMGTTGSGIEGNATGVNS